jgi:hypothetical protein
MTRIVKSPPDSSASENSQQDSCPISASENSGEHWRFCLQCGHELINEKCKSRCPRCHYFMSCSDFDFAT